MKKKNFTLSILLKFSFIFLIASTVFAQKTVNSKLQIKSYQNLHQKQNCKDNTKIKHFLDIILKAESFQEVLNAYKNMQFSSKEKAELEKKLARPPYSTKLNILKNRYKTLQKSKCTTKVKIKAQKLFSYKQQQLLQKQKQEIRRLDQITMRKFNRIKAKYKSIKSGRIEHLTPFMQKALHAKTTVLGTRLSQNIPEEDRPVIERIRPNPANPGQTISILGQNFGNSRGNGRVTLLMGDGFILCSVKRWRDNYVDVTIPSFLSSMVGEGGIDAKILLEPNNRRIGYIKDLHIVADAQRFVPEITSISPRELQPGQLLLIEGKNFLSSRGRVRFIMRSLGRIADGEIISWADNYVAVRLPNDLEGFTARQGLTDIELENTRGNDITSPISIHLKPILETKIISKELYYMRSHRRDPSSSVQTVFDYRLLNNWRVVDSHIELITSWSQSGGYERCEYVTQPSPGSSSPRSIIRLITGDPGLLAWSDIMCSAYVTIQGPKGVPYH